MKNLCRIESALAGLEYTSAAVNEGETLDLERESGNEHDGNAIRVSRKGAKIGYIDRHDAQWLAPLMDGGLVEIKVSPMSSGSQTGTPAELSVRITSKGASILNPRHEDSAKAAVHNSLLSIYLYLDTYSLEPLRQVATLYERMLCGLQPLPETMLIFKAILSRIHQLEKKPAPELAGILQKLLSEISFGKPVGDGGITIIPLYGRLNGTCAYIDCGEALEKKILSVEEVCDSGIVSNLKAVNTGDRPVFIVSGQGLKGAKQDRIVNISIIIDARTTATIPVSCVEARRWHYSKGKTFTKSNLASPSIRFCLHSSVNKSMRTVRKYSSDQSGIWHTVDKVAESKGVESDTSCLNDVYDSYESRLKEFSEKAKYPEHASGLAVFIGRTLVSLDIFGHPDLMKASWDDIVKSVALEAISPGQSKEYKVPEESKAAVEIRKFLEAVAANSAPPEKSPGRGLYVRSQSNRHEAGILVDNAKVVHLSAYKAG